jgi:hypothetical protein
MARISTYPVDTDVTGTDKVIGTDATGLITKNYTLNGISSWMNASGSLKIVGQNNYSYLVDDAVDGVISGPTSNANFGNITNLRFTKTSAAGVDVSAYLATLVGRQVILARLDNPNNFGVYKLVSFAVDPADDFYFNAVLSLTVANGNITANKYYGFAVYPNLPSDGDLNFTFNQPTPAATWSIAHNLGKNPSVSVVDSAGTLVHGEVDYINDNSLIITFSAAFSGKAYLN